MTDLVLSEAQKSRLKTHAQQAMTTGQMGQLKRFIESEAAGGTRESAYLMVAYIRDLIESELKSYANAQLQQRGK